MEINHYFPFLVKEEAGTSEGMVLDSDVPAVGDEVDIPGDGTADVPQPRNCAELFNMPTKTGNLLPILCEW